MLSVAAMNLWQATGEVPGSRAGSAWIWGSLLVMVLVVFVVALISCYFPKDPRHQPW